MRKFAILISLLVVIVTSCNKPTEDKPVEKSDFEIYGFDSASYIQSGVPYFLSEGTLPIMARRLSGPSEVVSLSTADVPKGMRIFFIDSTEAVITTTLMDRWFGFSFEIDTNIKVGNYYPKVIGTSASGIIKKDSIVVRILP